MRYWADSAIATIPSLATCDNETRAQALKDADKVYRYIKQNPGITDEDLRKYSERNDYTPDRVTLALAVLSDTGQILGVDTTTAQVNLPAH